MRRLRLALVAATAITALSATAGAQAAVPTLGPLSATNIQGVSALLKGTVDPEGEASSYRFEYLTATAYEANLEASKGGFEGAAVTAETGVGSGGEPRPARAAISGLEPDTAYRYRLVATNASGSAASAAEAFTTTHGFGFLAGTEGFSIRAIAEGGAPASAAGSHPFQVNLGFGLNQAGEFEGQPGVVFPDGDMRRLRIELPPGMNLNPAAIGACPTDLFHVPRSSPFAPSRSGENCPAPSQIGTVEVRTSLEGGQVRRFGVFNVEPSPGVTARIGFAPFGTPFVFDVFLRAQENGEYALTLEANDIPQSLDFHRLDLVLWGNPWGPSHNGERGNCLNETEPEFPWAKCNVPPSTANPRRAYLTLPTGCSASLPFTARATSWQQPGEVTREALNRNEIGSVISVSSCHDILFDPDPLGFLPTKKASSPSGYEFRLTNDNTGFTSPGLRAPAQAKTAVIRLPEGVTVNPSVGAGLEICRPHQYAAETATSTEGQGCPAGSKIGQFRVRSPMFPSWFEGAVYLASPDDPTTPAPGAENPFDSLLAIYLVAKLPERGVLIKLAGKIAADHESGNLTTTFDGLPQLPYTDLELIFRPGQRAFLVSPPACGPAPTQIDLTPWSGPAGLQATSSASVIETGINDGPCPNGSTLPFAPDAVTGGVNAHVGSYTPYFVRLSREDTEQEITSYSLVLPRGITGKLAGIPFCPDAAIAASRERRGFAELAAPSCPAASQVGHTLTGYGVGSTLAYSQGRIYLAGPYNGQPLSLVTINAATLGPIDLGTFVIRSAFSIDRRTAQLQIDSRSSDPIPHIIDGIPLHLRDIRVYLDRPQFTHNPSSCESSQMVSTLTGSGARFSDPSDDSSATVSRHFQLLNCLTLGFRPKLGLRLRGGSRRGSHPSLRATFAARGPQDSNLKRIEVTMPHSLFLAHEHIRDICSQARFDAEQCPQGSVYGRAALHTPLFDEPLRGSVYLRTSATSRLPDLVALLRSGEVRIVLEGRIGPSKYGLRALFDDVPDAPIDRFTMVLFGGKRGLLENSSNICVKAPIASVKALGQNNLGAVFSSKLRGQCNERRGRRAHNGKAG